MLSFMKNHNLISGEKGFKFENILWLLKDKEFFDKTIEILRGRKIFNMSVWSYAFYHKSSTEVLREYLTMAQPHTLISGLSPTFSSELLTLTPKMLNFQHLDYFPMINSRVHRLKGQQS